MKNRFATGVMMSARTYTQRVACVSLLSLTLLGCFRPPYNDFRHDSNSLLRTRSTVGDADDQIIAGSGAIKHGSNLAIISELQKNDIQFVQNGDTMTLIVPTDHYFEFDSPKLNEVCYEGLNNIIRLLEIYPCSTIYVAGFTDNVGSRDRRNRMSQAQAETMLTFLWAHNISAVRLKAEGYGSKFAVGDNHLIHGNAYNRRIEIQWDTSSPAPQAPQMMVPVSSGMK